MTTMEVQTKVMDIQKQLEKLSSPEAEQSQALSLLESLRDTPMDLELLSSTGIGKTVNQIRKESKDKEVITLAISLIKKWKKHLNEPGGGEASPPKSISSKSGKTKKSEEEPAVTTKKPKLKAEDPPEKAVSSFSSPKGTTCFPPITETEDAVRLKCRELLLTALQGDGDLPAGTNDPEFLAGQLEDHIYREFNNTDIKYKNRVRSRVANLKDTKNPNLRLNFLVGEISPKRLARMTAEEMASDELKAIRTQLVKEAINDAQLATNPGTKTDLLKCGKCRKRDCTYNQLQTRSSDEPMTTFVLCNNCGNRWKFC